MGVLGTGIQLLVAGGHERRRRECLGHRPVSEILKSLVPAGREPHSLEVPGELLLLVLLGPHLKTGDRVAITSDGMEVSQQGLDFVGAFLHLGPNELPGVCLRYIVDHFVRIIVDAGVGAAVLSSTGFLRFGLNGPAVPDQFVHLFE